MILFLDEQRRIRAYNALISAEEASKYKGAVGFDGEYPPVTEKREGFYPVYYLETDGKTIRTEWKKIVIQELTQLDRMEAQLMKSQDEIRQEGADMVMEEMKKRGLIV